MSYSFSIQSNSWTVAVLWPQNWHTAPSIDKGQPRGMCDSSSASPLFSMIDPSMGTSIVALKLTISLLLGLAVDQANILSYRFHFKWTEFLMDTRMSDPPQGFQQVSMKQLELADKKLFTLLAEATREGIKAQAGGKPCVIAFDKCFESTEVRHLLQPRPMPSGHAVNPGGNKPPRSPPLGGAPSPKKPRANGKGKGLGKSSDFQRIPHDLLHLGAVANTPKGHRLCFSFNLKSCNSQTKQQKCEKGLHLCCVKGCHKAHPALDCPAKKAE